MKMLYLHGQLIPEYDTDDPADVQVLQSMRPDPSVAEIYPRITCYGSPEAAALGLTPLAEDLDIIPEDMWKDALAHAHENQSTARFHQQATWAPAGTRWDQDGLGLCWAWGGGAALMDCRGAEKKPTVQLAPITMGHLVGWQNRGNTLESLIKGLREDGMGPASCVPDDAWHTLDPGQFDPCWKTERDLYRLDKVWDADPNNRLASSITITCAGRPGYVAYDWWRHALDLVDWLYDQEEGYKAVLRNSHGSKKLLILKGSRAVPDEEYGFASTVNVAG